MKESKLIQIFKKLLISKLADIPYFWYKIPDTKGLGGMRPCDVILICNGQIFCMEFKVGNNKLTCWQKFHMAKMQIAGAAIYVVNDHNYYVQLAAILQRIKKEKK